MIMRTGIMIMAVGMIVPMGVIVKAVPMDVIVRHGVSLAPSGHKSACK